MHDGRKALASKNKLEPLHTNVCTHAGRQIDRQTDRQTDK